MDLGSLIDYNKKPGMEEGLNETLKDQTSDISWRQLGKVGCPKRRLWQRLGTV